MRKSTRLVLLLTVLFTADICAQQATLRFENVSLDEGLSQSTVLCIYQSSKGFMWFGTQEGLNKYDGYDFTVYRHDPVNTNSLSNDFVRAIVEDESGALWIGTDNRGLNKFDPATDNFSRFLYHPDSSNGLNDNAILKVYIDDAGIIWIGTYEGGLNKLTFESTSGNPHFEHFLHDSLAPTSLSSNHVTALHRDNDGALWVGTYDGGLNKLTFKAPAVGEMTNNALESIHHFQHAPNTPNSLGNNHVMAIHEDASERLWIATRGSGVSLLNRGRDDFLQIQHNPDDPTSLGNNIVRAITEDNDGNLWFATYGGGLSKLSGWDSTAAVPNPIFTNFRNDPYSPGSLSDDFLYSAFIDRSNVLWIGTESAGLNKLTAESGRFTHYRHHPYQSGSLSSNSIWSVWEDRSGKIWVGTNDGGLNQLDQDNQTFRHYKHDRTNPNSISHNSVVSIHEDTRHDGVLWLGTMEGGLNRLDVSTGNFTRYLSGDGSNAGPASNGILALHQDRNDVIWLGTFDGGLNRFDPYAPGAPHFTHYKMSSEDPNSIRDNFVWEIYEDRTGNLWLGTFDGGINKLIRTGDPDSVVFEYYLHDTENPNSLADNKVMTIHQDSQHDNIFWIGTKAGLNRFDVASGNFTLYTENDGLPNNLIYGILQDETGCLWLSTNRGLLKFNPETETFKNYDAGDGLQSNEFNSCAYHRGHSGRMYFGGENGFNAFFPDQITDNPYVPPMVITAFRTFDGILRQDITSSDDITVSYKEKYLTFDYAALHYANPEKNRYAFMLEGFDEYWISAENARSANYTNLSPGNYTFKVKGANNDGVWNEDGVAVDFTITTPPWRTWWAYLLYLLLALAIIYALWRNEVNRLRLTTQLRLEQAEAEKLKELDHLKSSFFANISHEFRTPLTLILGPIESAISTVKNNEIKQQLGMAFQNGRRLLRLINQILDLSRLDADMMSLKASYGNIIPFIKGIFYTFEHAAREKDVQLHFEASSEEIEGYFDTEKLEPVFYNLIANAIKFIPASSGGQISCSVEQSSQSMLPGNPAALKIRIRDTGIGIPAEQLPHIFDRFFHENRPAASDQKGTGIGLALVKEIVSLHHGEIFVESIVGEGTVFTVELPLGKDHLGASEIVDEPLVIPSAGKPALATSEMTLSQGSKEKVAENSEDVPVVLIVEDNTDLRAFIRQHLNDDYRILEAADGVAGLEKAIEAVPDLIVSDVMMPKMDGFVLCQSLKEDQRTSHIPVVLLTARAGEESKIAGLETGADDYLTKPFSSAELRARIKNLIEQRQKLKERFTRAVVLKPSEIAITSADESFLNKVKDAVERNISDEHFSVDDLSREVGMSRVQLHRKLKALTNQSSGQFILSLRLQRATDLIRNNAGTVSEIAYMVGFNTPNYFAKCFRAQLGCSPSEYKLRQGRQD